MYMYIWRIWEEFIHCALLCLRERYYLYTDYTWSMRRYNMHFYSRIVQATVLLSFVAENRFWLLLLYLYTKTYTHTFIQYTHYTTIYNFQCTRALCRIDGEFSWFSVLERNVSSGHVFTFISLIELLNYIQCDKCVLCVCELLLKFIRNKLYCLVVVTTTTTTRLAVCHL